MQYAKFPMQYVNITQVPNNDFSHKGSISAWDNAGKDTGIDDAFAPFDCKVVWKDTGSANTGVLIQNTDFVECADGLIREPNSIKVLLWHDNNISDLYVGKDIKQGVVFYQEGTAGRATGNHVHFNVGIGKHDGKYPLVKNEFGVYEIKGEINPTKIFFVDDKNIVKNTKGMKWVKYVEKKQEAKPIIEVKKIEVNEVVKVIGNFYATGQKIPEWVKGKTYRVSRINGDKALLNVINSWVKLKDLVSI